MKLQPSGGLQIVHVIYGFTSYILAKQFPEWRFQIYALAVVLITAIGFSRLYLGVHWLTDVKAGYGAGLVWLIACIISFKLIPLLKSAKLIRISPVQTLQKANR
jgi:membrane-associated phospholipid phosphatase